MGIRIGSDRLPALSLDAKNDLGEPILGEIAEPETPCILAFDWDRFARELRLSRTERRVFDAHWRRGIPRYRLAGDLGIAPQAALSSFRSVVAKLRSPRAASCLSLEPLRRSNALAFRESLGSGLRCWSLALPDNVFEEVMKKEYLPISQQVTDETPKRTFFYPRKVGTKMTTSTSFNQLEAEISEQRAKRDRISQRGREADDTLARLRREASQIENEISTSQTESILNEIEWPDPKKKRRLSEIRAEIPMAEAQATAARSALAQLTETISRLEGDREARLFEKRGAKIADHLPKILRRLDELILELRAFHKDIAQDGQFYLDELFPTLNSSDPWDDVVERAALSNLLGAIRRADFHCDGFARQPYHRRLAAKLKA